MVKTVTRRKIPQYKISRTNKFIDPHPLGFGTLPEKMVYSKLSREGIAFYYLNDLTFSDPAADYFKIFQADFYIPSVKVIIEVQGAHWHSMPKTIEADAFKFAVYETFGYTALAWWDYEIESDLDALFAKEPLLVGIANPALASSSTELTPIARTKTDSSQGIRTLNRKHRKPLSYHSVTIKRRGAKKPKTTYKLPR